MCSPRNSLYCLCPKSTQTWSVRCTLLAVTGSPASEAALRAVLAGIIQKG